MIKALENLPYGLTRGARAMNSASVTPVNAAVQETLGKQIVIAHATLAKIAATNSSQQLFVTHSGSKTSGKRTAFVVVIHLWNAAMIN